MSAIAVSPRVRERVSLRAVIGAAALTAAVSVAWWIAAGAAGGSYLLSLATGVNPSWSDGPLRALGFSLSPSSFSVALIAFAAAYAVALACADSISLRWALGAVALANLAFTLAPSIVSTDVFGYVAYAREAAHGLNPYVSPPAALGHNSILPLVFWQNEPSPYGPLFTLSSAPLGFLSASAAFWVYKAAAGAAGLALAWLVAAVARARNLSPSRAALFVGLNPVLLLYAVAGAHNDLLAVAFVAAAIGLLQRGRESAAVAAVVAGAAVKVTLGLALPFVLLGARRRGAALRGAAFALVALGVPTLAVFGPHIFDQLHRITSQQRFDITFSGPRELSDALGRPIDSLVRALCTGAAAAVALVQIVRAARGADYLATSGWAVLALLASIASLAPWYLVWLLPLAAVARSRPLRAAALLATGYLLAVHLPALGGVPFLT